MRNKRKRTRIDGSYKGLLKVGGREVPMRTRNLSLKGMLCLPSVPIEAEPGEHCTVTMPLGPDIRIVLECRVIRVEDGEVALDFTGMDEESYGHLSNCVRLMSANPDAIEREQIIPAFRA